MRIPKIRAKFGLESKDFSIDYVSHELGIQPDWSRTFDGWPDVITNNPNLPEDLKPRTIWSMQTTKDECWAVEIQLVKLINRLDGKVDIIQKLSRELNLQAYFVVVVDMLVGDHPEMVLSKEIVAFMSSVNAEISFDMYIDETNANENVE